MALSKQDKVIVKLAGEINVAAYIRVQHIAGTKHSITANVVFLTNDTNGEMYKSSNYLFVPEMNRGNFIKQAYDYLKTLPEFADAEDC